MVDAVQRRAQVLEGGGGVTVATIHKAKGLEWDAVLLPGLTDGYLPIFYAKSPAEIEEERRLLYVAITRARERLALSYAVRCDNGRDNSPSRFLSQIALLPPPAVNEPTAVCSAYSVGDRVGQHFRNTDLAMQHRLVDHGDQFHRRLGPVERSLTAHSQVNCACDFGIGHGGEVPT